MEQNEKKEKKVLDFVIKTMNGMAYGLFATLIIGTIIGTIADAFADGNYMNQVLGSVAKFLKDATGFGIGLGIAWSLKFEGLKMISLAICGGIAEYMSGTDGLQLTAKIGFKTPDPLTIYVVVVIVALLIQIILVKKTPVDIIIIPLLTVVLAVILTILLNEPVSWITQGISKVIEFSIDKMSLITGVVIAVLMGMALTAPISSAAIAFALFQDSSSEAILLAGGAATIGCCTQMLGFMVMSRKDNNIGVVISVGIGTSMLQFKNILKKPIIWLPTIIVSGVLGALSTTLIELKCLGISAGMGTSGLVGQVGTISAMGSSLSTWLIIILFEIVLPIVLVFGVDLIFRKKGWIQPGDLTI